ncbi:hypothetical protein DFAR_1310004 [Desulfarculales bacterium]
MLSALVRSHVDIKNATLITDEFSGYIRIKTFMPEDWGYKHERQYSQSY